MGAVLRGRRDDSLPPLTVVGHTPLQGLDYETPVPAAQVKSAILLAGLRAEGRTTVRERVATRDHTERMLRARGVDVDDASRRVTAWRRRWKEGRGGGDRPGRAGRRLGGRLLARRGLDPPRCRADPAGVGVNPTRRAVIDLLRQMGADIDERPVDPRLPTEIGEPIADLSVRSAELQASTWGPAEVAAAIDEIPVLCLAAARPRARRPSVARASCGTRNPTGSPASPPVCGPGRAMSRSTATTSDPRRRMLRGGADRQPRRPSARDDLRDRRPCRCPTTTIERPGSGACPIPASSPISKGCEHDQARRPHRPPGGPFAVRRDAAGRVRRARDRRDATSCGIARRSSLPTPIGELRTDDFLGANVTIPHKERVVPMVDRQTEEAQRPVPSTRSRARVSG